MKLLLVVQAVDAESPVLGFIIGWITEFAAQCEAVEVIAFKTGRYDLPADVRVHPVTRGGALTRFMSYRKLLREILPRVDGVFVHMSPEYAIAAWPQASRLKKPIVLWYAHKSVTLRLRVAAALSKKVATSAGASLNIHPKNAVHLGQGIPTDLFTPGAPVAEPKLLSVGRITPVKRIELMIDALDAMRESGIPATLTLVGGPVTESDRAYADRLRAQAKSLGIENAVIFAGGAPYAKLPETYRAYALHLNAAPTGAPDKAAFEAMACGVPCIVVNGTFRALLGSDAETLVADADGQDIARKAMALLAHPDGGLRARLRALVERGHSLKRLVHGIIEQYGAS